MAASASFMVLAMRLRGMSMPSLVIVSLKAWRSSPRLIASTWTPMILTPYLSSTPARASSLLRLSPDWPPRFGSRASGRSLATIFVTLSSVSGSMYVTSAMPGSVMMVAGLELTSTIL